MVIIQNSILHLFRTLYSKLVKHAKIFYIYNNKKKEKKEKETKKKVKYFQKTQQYSNIKTSKEIHGRQQVTKTFFGTEM